MRILVVEDNELVADAIVRGKFDAWRNDIGWKVLSD